jgi:hypothetical protein
MVGVEVDDHQEEVAAADDRQREAAAVRQQAMVEVDVEEERHHDCPFLCPSPYRRAQPRLRRRLLQLQLFVVLRQPY